MFSRIVFILFMVLFLAAHTSYADWFSDYSSMITSDSSFYETQRQGFLSLGGASYRVRTQRTPLISITTPKIQAGCGGIDAFWGGLAYLQPEYLVQAFQNIMSAAPAFAFDIALKVLCEQCYEIKSTLESIANLVNQMAMDECGAARALANVGGNFIVNKMHEMGITGTSSGSSGNSPFLGALKEYVQEPLGDVKNWLDDFYSTEFCPQGNPDLIGPCQEFASFADGPKSFWQSLAKYESKKNTDDDNDPFVGCETNGICDMSSIIMGIFGDIFIGALSQGTSADDQRLRTIPVAYVAPKTSMSVAEIVKAMLSGTTNSTVGSSSLSPIIPAMRFTGTGNPTATTDNYEAVLVDTSSVRFGERAEEALSKIAQAISSGDSTLMDAETIKFINEQVFPLWRIINIFAYQGDAAIATIQNGVIKEFAAISSAYYFLNDIANLAMNEIDKYTNTLNRGLRMAPVNKENFRTETKKLIRHITEFRRELSKSYRQVIQKFYLALDNITKISTLEKEVTVRLMNNYDYSPFLFQ